MSRARRAGGRALPFALILVVALAALVSAARRPDPTAPRLANPLAAVTWPVSTLVLSEVQTGGASASDEFAEIHNAGAAAVDLAGLELVYATSSGSTVTRKASWAASTVLDPGRHLFVANAAGVYAPTADATYSSGFAATGGALVLRPIGGTPVDAVAWGDATNAFVEGTAAAAPAAGSSIERRPGGASGNGTDTNDNAADFVTAAPSPQNLLAAPTPTPGGSPSPSASASATPTASPSATATPTPVPTPTPTPTPTPDPTTTPSPTPTPSPTATSTPTPTAPPTPTPTATPTPTPTPTATPNPTPTPTPVPVVSIADARALPDGANVRIAGTLTTGLGAIDASRNGFVQDGTAGIAVRLDAAIAPALPAGSTVIVDGTLGSYFSLRVVTTDAATVQVTGSASLPDPVGAATGAAGEDLEGLRLTVVGAVTESPTALADGLGVTIDDGSGPLRLVVGSLAQAGQAIGTGDLITAMGPLGQRDSSGTGTAGYRLHATAAGELVVEHPGPSPTPTPTPSPDPSPSSSPSTDPSTGPTPTPSATARPSASAPPSPSPSPTSAPSTSPSTSPVTSIADARLRPVGSRVTVVGVVTAPAGRLGTPSLFAIQDSTGGIIVRGGDETRPALGTRVEVTGAVADPYGQTEIRSLTAYGQLATAPLPSPRSVDGAALGEATEGRLVTLDGIAQGRPIRSTSGDLSVVLETANGTARIVADASAGLGATFVAKGDRVRVNGIVGQHASRKGAIDGYRVWLRGASDVVRLAAAPSESATPQPSGSGSTAAPPRRTIAAAILAGSGDVTVEGVVTAPAALLEATHRRIVIQDDTGAIEVLLPTGASAPGVGRRVRVGGEVGRAYGAPRMKADSVTGIGSAPAVRPIELRGAPGVAHEWRLVSIRGDVLEVHRSGERWTADLQVAGVHVLVIGLPGAGVPSSALSEGRTATITGIVRRPYPSASDRRFAVLPRSGADVHVGGSADGGTTPRAPTRSAGSGAAAGSSQPAGPLDVDLIRLPESVGLTVRVGGLVESVDAQGFRLDDGTAVAQIALAGPAADLAGSIIVGDALNATGRVVRDATSGAVGVEVSDPAGIVLAGDLGNEDPGSAAPVESGPGGAAATAQGAVTLGAGFGDSGIPGAGAGVAGIVLVSIASLAVTVLRRKRMRQRLAARIAVRLAAIAPPVVPVAAADATPRSPRSGG